MTYEVRLRPRGGAGQAQDATVLGGLLIGWGAPAGSVVEQAARGRRSVSLYLASADQARSWMRRVREAKLRGVTASAHALRDADWQDAWKRHLRPFRLTPGITVVPAWSAQARRGPAPDRIVLETGKAFGTGQHATTRWMAQWIARLRGRFADVLDVGTGSGILSVVAARCGARKVLAVDIDPDAVASARRNLQVNGCRGCRIVTGDFGRRPAGRRFDLIVANIGTEELLAMRPRLLAALAPGGHLAVTGIVRRHAARFRREFRGRPLRCVAFRQNRDWAAFLYSK
jgi:ribosomal protein L11 methyltransferase